MYMYMYMCLPYISVFSPGHFRVAAHYAFILEGLVAATQVGHVSIERGNQ